MNHFQNCPHDYHYKYEEEILDLGCRLTGQRCAPTMVFRTIQIFSNNCMQQCTCGEEYNYNEEEGECIRNVRIFQRFINSHVFSFSNHTNSRIRI